MTALLATLKCGCRRSLCFKCGKVVSPNAYDYKCYRHGFRSYGAFSLTTGECISICHPCAVKPAWPPPHANWSKAR